MTIKHAISKIGWAWNYYITQLSSSSSWRRGVVGKNHTRPKGLEALMSWGPEKMLIRCSKESQHPAEWTPGPPVEHQENEKDTTLTAISLGGSKYFSYVRSPAPYHTQTLNNLFEPLQIKWEVYIFIKKSSCVCLYYCGVMILHVCTWVNNSTCLIRNSSTLISQSYWPDWLARIVVNHSLDLSNKFRAGRVRLPNSERSEWGFQAAVPS